MIEEETEKLEMEEVDIIAICEGVLDSLSKMDYEKIGGSSEEQLVFPLKIQAMGTKKKDRVSEQELRQLFIEKFKVKNKELYFSIETPTQEKYKIGKSYDGFEYNINGQSALLDMCIFNRVSDIYNRILNIEFKSKNASIRGIGKDVLKLMHEKQNGAFIHLLKNTNKGTLCNKGETGVFNKMYQSFNDFQTSWRGDNKYIQLVIISLSQETLIHRKIYKSEIENLEEIFFIDNIGCGNIMEIEGSNWGKYKVN